jgi:hypothetical protein
MMTALLPMVGGVLLCAAAAHMPAATAAASAAAAAALSSPLLPTPSDAVGAPSPPAAFTPKIHICGAFPPPPPQPHPPPHPPPSPSPPPSTCVEAAENSIANIGCPVGEVIASVGFASFGSPTGNCSVGFHASATCNSSHSRAVVTAACIGKQACALDVSCSTFHEKLTNPGAFCWTVLKRLAVTVTCRKKAAVGLGEMARGGALYDPSGPLLSKDGIWHLFEDAGGWSHYISRDLLRWTKLSSSTGFGGMTGSVSVTPAGTFAIWPARPAQTFNRSKALDATLTRWGPFTTAVPLPPGVKQMQDPGRALQLADGRWYVVGACAFAAASRPGSALCLFRATDATLTAFEPASGTDGFFFSINKTLGAVDANGVWHNGSYPLTGLDVGCPDLFPFGDKFGLIATCTTPEIFPCLVFAPTSLLLLLPQLYISAARDLLCYLLAFLVLACRWWAAKGHT